MSAEVLVFGFNNTDGASVTRQLLRGAQAEGQLTVDDAAIIVRVGDSAAQVTHELDSAIKASMARGSLIGLALGSLFAPVAGLLIGAVAGAAVGSTKGLSIDHVMAAAVAETLEPDRSALIVRVAQQARESVVLASAARFGGVLLN